MTTAQCKPSKSALCLLAGFPCDNSHWCMGNIADERTAQDFRRRRPGSGSGAARACNHGALAAAGVAASHSIPPLPSAPTPGKPGLFHFLTGGWCIHHRQPPAGSDEWIEFDGEATVHRILAGVGSIEELRIPARKFSGLARRLLDVEKKVWADHGLYAVSGVMTVPASPSSKTARAFSLPTTRKTASP